MTFLPASATVAPDCTGFVFIAVDYPGIICWLPGQVKVSGPGRVPHRTYFRAGGVQIRGLDTTARMVYSALSRN